MAIIPGNLWQFPTYIHYITDPFLGLKCSLWPYLPCKTCFTICVIYLVMWHTIKAINCDIFIPQPNPEISLNAHISLNNTPIVPKPVANCSWGHCGFNGVLPKKEKPKPRFLWFNLWNMWIDIFRNIVVDFFEILKIFTFETCSLGL